MNKRFCTDTENVAFDNLRTQHTCKGTGLKINRNSYKQSNNNNNNSSNAFQQPQSICKTTGSTQLWHCKNNVTTKQKTNDFNSIYETTRRKILKLCIIFNDIVSCWKPFKHVPKKLFRNYTNYVRCLYLTTQSLKVLQELKIRYSSKSTPKAFSIKIVGMSNH